MIGELMQGSDSSQATQGPLLITARLRERRRRPSDFRSESAALVALAAGLSANAPRNLQALAETARRLCRADTSGVCMLEQPFGISRWQALSGALASYAGGIVNNHDGLIEAVLGQNAPQLVSFSSRHATPVTGAMLPCPEALVAPLVSQDKAAGTLWVMCHTAGTQFDAEDARLLANLAAFGGAAHQLCTALEEERLECEQARRKLRQRSRQLWQACIALGA
jgi:hypothetical protein